MKRWVLVSCFVACILCLVQAFPQGESTTERAPSAQTDATFNSVIKPLENIMKDPNLTKLVQDGQKAFNDFVQALQNQAAEMIPKTE